MERRKEDDSRKKRINDSQKKEEERGGEKRDRVREEKKKDKNKEESIEEIKILFWNVAGIKKKERDFWNYIERFDVIGLCETWLEEKEWMKMEKLLPKAINWCSQHAERNKKKGRAKGGIITGVRKGLGEIGVGTNVNGVQERRLRVEGEIWRIMTVYNGIRMKDLKKIIESKIEELEEGILCIGGDFNVRLGTEGGRWEGEEDENRVRNSKDKIINKDGRELLSLVEERRWEIGNGNAREDEEGEWTYIGGRGESVVDYLIVNQEGWNKIKKFKIGKRTESDHQP